MNWKTDLKLADLDPTSRIEVTCRTCGHSHVLTRDQLLAHITQRRGSAVRNTRQTREAEHVHEEPEHAAARNSHSGAYLDEIEARLTCAKRTCRGSTRIALIHAHKMEGFVGGMA